MVKGQAGGRRVLSAEQMEKRRMRNKKILHGLEETGKYLGKVAIDSGLAEKAVKVVAKIGRRKARALAGKEGKKRCEDDGSRRFGRTYQVPGQAGAQVVG